jgi:Flp pilus assembly protein TadG
MRARGTRRERGAVAIIVAIMLLVLGGFMALSLNAGHLLSVRGELQNSSDAGALGGAWDLDCTADGIEKARVAAFDYAARHSTDNQSITPDDTTVEFGYWSMENQKFFPFSNPTANPEMVSLTNAIQVRTTRADGNAAPVFFPVFLGGKNTANVGANAIAVRGGPCTEKCALPLAFAKCQIVDGGGFKCGEDHRLFFHSDPADNIAFSVLNQYEDVNTDTIGLMLDGFNTDPPTCGTPAVADPSNFIEVANGSNLNPNIDKFQALAMKGPYPVAILDLACSESPASALKDPVTGKCLKERGGDTSAKMVKSGALIGFASVMIKFAGTIAQYRLLNDGVAPPESDCYPESTKLMIINVECGAPTTATAGCECFGLLPPPRLVE